MKRATNHLPQAERKVFTPEDFRKWGAEGGKSTKDKRTPEERKAFMAYVRSKRKKKQQETPEEASDDSQ
jgi:hypothetical protein